MNEIPLAPIDRSNPAFCDARRPARIAIVGGGTAGWMAAATLRRRLRCSVTVIESRSVPGVGVGEATIPAMLDWIENMEINEDDFIRRTAGTYKLAIRFDNWIEKSHRYWHPFGIAGVEIDGSDMIHFWNRGVREGWIAPDVQYADFSLQKQLCLSGCGPRQAMRPSIVDNYAFHLDAGRLAAFLRELAISEGVEHRFGNVHGIDRREDGSISAVHVGGQHPLVADLYIDCSGFSSELIERGLNVPWLDWSDQLLCDRAVVVRGKPRGASVAPFTISSGMDAGWAWTIPLRENVGFGYVYSSAHSTDGQANDALLQHAAVDPDSAQTRQLNMRVGRRAVSWAKNCVAIGLSAGFIEPLESTGIFLIQRALDDLVECLPQSPGEAPKRQLFNDRSRMLYEEIRDFVLMHYILSRRNDTSFWRDARGVTLPDSLSELLATYDESGKIILRGESPVFAEANHYFILAGAGREPGIASDSHVRKIPELDSTELQLLFEQITNQNIYYASQLAPHHEILDIIHAGEKRFAA